MNAQISRISLTRRTGKNTKTGNAEISLKINSLETITPLTCLSYLDIRNREKWAKKLPLRVRAYARVRALLLHLTGKTGNGVRASFRGFANPQKTA